MLEKKEKYVPVFEFEVPSNRWEKGTTAERF